MIICGDGGGRGAGGGGHFNDDNPLKGPRSVPDVLCSCPLNDSLVYFVVIVLTNSFCPLVLSIDGIYPFSVTTK